MAWSLESRQLDYASRARAAQQIQRRWQHHRNKSWAAQQQQQCKTAERGLHSREMAEAAGAPPRATLGDALLEQIISKLDRLDRRIERVEAAQLEIAENVKPPPSHFLSVHTETVENNRRIESMSEAAGALGGGGATFLALNQSMEQAQSAAANREKPWYLLHPESRFCSIWDVFSSVALLVTGDRGLAVFKLAAPRASAPCSANLL